MSYLTIRYILIIILLSCPVYPVYAQSNKFSGSKNFKKENAKYDKLSSKLIRLIEESEISGITPALQSAKQKGFKVHGEKITVIVEAEKQGYSSKVRNFILQSSGEIFSTYKNLLKVRIKISDLKKLNKGKGIRLVRQPYKPFPHRIIGEQVSLTGATIPQNKGINGDGIKVAIIDEGFANLSWSIYNNQLPYDVVTYDLTEDGIDTVSCHGTAVAEVVCEMAPSAKLYLIKIGDDVDLGNAKNYCIDNGIKIINHSMGWVLSGWGRGDGYICDIADDANNNGILWVNSAGNSARRHFQGMYTSGGIYHEYNPGTNINIIGDVTAGKTIGVFLSWDDEWGLSGNDYDLHLYYWSGASWLPSGSSDDIQNGNDYPIEAICIDNPSSVKYGVRVEKKSGIDKEFQLYSFYQDFNIYIEAGSLMAPADAKGVFTVGAIAYSNWASGPQEDFSSQGPTQDGRIKPDISGVDNNENFTYGRFPGTSSSSPCIAGAAALVWNAYAFSGTPETVRDYITDYAVDMGTPGKDNIYGWGRVKLDDLVMLDEIKIPQNNVGVYNNLVDFSDPLKNKLRFAFIKDGDYTITVYNAAGGMVKEWNETYYSYDLFDWDGKVNGKLLGGSIYFIRIKSDDFEKTYKFLVVK